LRKGNRMPASSKNILAETITKQEKEIISEWLELQSKADRTSSAAEREETTRNSREFMEALKGAVKAGQTDDLDAPAWTSVRELLSDLSTARARGGYPPGE